MTRSPALLTEFVISLLTPFLLTGPLNDPDLARRIARETVEGYQATTTGQLVSVTQLLAFALTAVDNLRLSLPETVATTTKLRLRSNANALNRSAERATATLESQRQATPPKPHQTDKAWAGAMTNVAQEFKKELPNIPLKEQPAQLARIAALTTVAQQLNSGTAPSLKSRLLSSTTLLTPGQGPSHSR